MTRSFVAGSILLVFLAACSETAPPGTAVAGRWYTVEQVELGGQLYQQHCAVCHAADGSATADWRTRDADGIYPPPPLNGTAHTWHHPREMLDFTIVNGGAEFGGVMPGFSALLDESERHAVVAWIQNLWSDEIYTNWKAIDERS